MGETTVGRRKRSFHSPSSAARPGAAKEGETRSGSVRFLIIAHNRARAVDGPYLFSPAQERYHQCERHQTRYHRQNDPQSEPRRIDVQLELPPRWGRIYMSTTHAPCQEGMEEERTSRAEGRGTEWPQVASWG